MPNIVVPGRTGRTDLAEKLRQEEVIVELQQGGVVRETIGVVAG